MENLIWLVVIGGLFFLMMRKGGCCGGGHSHGKHQNHTDNVQVPSGEVKNEKQSGCH